MRRAGDSRPSPAANAALWKLYLVDPQYGSLGYSGYADWPILEGRYTLAVLFEYAATLGLIDIEYTDPVGARDRLPRQLGRRQTSTTSAATTACAPSDSTRSAPTPRADRRLPATGQHHGAGRGP